MPDVVRAWRTPPPPKPFSYWLFGFSALLFVTLICLAPGLLCIAVPTYLLIYAVYRETQRSQRIETFSRRFEALDDIPQFLVEFWTVHQRGLEREDIGIVAFINGYLVFEGDHAAFNFRAKDVTTVHLAPKDARFVARIGEEDDPTWSFEFRPLNQFYQRERFEAHWKQWASETAENTQGAILPQFELTRQLAKQAILKAFYQSATWLVLGTVLAFILTPCLTLFVVALPLVWVLSRWIGYQDLLSQRDSNEV